MRMFAQLLADEHLGDTQQLMACQPFERRLAVWLSAIGTMPLSRNRSSRLSCKDEAAFDFLDVFGGEGKESLGLVVGRSSVTAPSFNAAVINASAICANIVRSTAF